MRTLALGGIVGPVLFGTVVVVSAAQRPAYNHVHQFISELGATGSSNAVLMNYMGFVPSGLLLAGFGLSLFWILPRSRTVLAASALVLLFGLGVAASGIVSCDLGCPQGGSVQNMIHDRMAPISFLFLILAAGLLSVRFRSLDAWRAFSLFSAASSVTGLVLLALLASTLETRRLTGLWQRLLLFVLFGWCMVIASYGYKVSGKTEEMPPGA